MREGIAEIDQQVYHSDSVPPVHVRTTRASSFPYAEHFHESFSIGVVFSGATRMRCMDGEMTVSAGQIVFLPPYDPHSCNPINNRLRGYHMFYIDPAWFERTFIPQGGGFKMRCRVLSTPPLFETMMRFAEAVMGNFGFAQWEAELEQVIKAFCVFETRDIARKPSPPLDVFRKYGADAPDETCLAAYLGVKRETFIRSFRRATGMPPGRYRQCLRLSHAVQLLGDDASIANAALGSGFCDQSHFHRMCVRYLSATPSQLRPRTYSDRGLKL